MAGSGAFDEETDAYVVLKLLLSDYKETERSMPAEGAITSPPLRSQARRHEKQLLKSNFRHWKVPYTASLPGWRDDSPIYMTWGDQLAGGIYLCDGNEFDGREGWGQLHYFFVDPALRGRGLHSLLFQKAIHRARSWGLDGVYISTDRRGLPEVYQRWGARYWLTIPKIRSL